MPTTSIQIALAAPIATNDTIQTIEQAASTATRPNRSRSRPRLNAAIDEVIAGRPIISPRRSAASPNSLSRWFGYAARNTPKITANDSPPPATTVTIRRDRSAVRMPPSCCPRVAPEGVCVLSRRKNVATAVTSAIEYGASAHRHPTAEVSTPDSTGNAASAMVSTPELRPIQAVRCSPVNASLSSTTARFTIPPLPMPITKRAPTTASNVGAVTTAIPPAPNRVRQGIRRFRRPNRSAMMPIRGAITMPGSGSAATSTPVELFGRWNSARMSGMAGDSSALPITLVNVTANTSGTSRRCAGVMLATRGTLGTGAHRARYRRDGVREPCDEGRHEGATTCTGGCARVWVRSDGPW